MKPFGAFKTGALAALFLSIPLFAAGKMPFPQNKDYGIRPTGSVTALANDVKTQYDRYVSKWYKSAGYISSPDTDGKGTTVSEAHGYGMMIFAIMDDKEKFDKMVSYYESNKGVANLMQWRIGWGGANGSATDGDLDIAFAFLLAETQWGGGQYLAKALKITDDIIAYESNSSKTFLKLGNTYTDESLARPSDWMAGHLRTFAKVDNGDATMWNNMATEMYARYNRFVQKNNSKGLISDFVRNDMGTDGDETEYDAEYYTNAGRVPMRFAMDYARHKNSTNEAAVKLITGRLAELCKNNPANIKAGYFLNGTAIGADNALEYLAPFGAGLISLGNQTLMNDTWKELQLEWTKGSYITSFGDALKMMSMLVMSGNWWTYGDVNTFKEPFVDTVGVIFDNFGNSYGDENNQTFLGALNGVVWGDKQHGGTGGDSTYFHGGCYWYTFAGEGDEILSADNKVITDNNINDIVKDNKLQITLKAAAGNKKEYGYAGIGAPIITDIKLIGKTTNGSDSTEATTRIVDMSKLTAITVQYQSDKPLLLIPVTKDSENSLFANADKWIGDYIMTLPATAGKVERKTFSVADLKPEPYSGLEAAVKAKKPELTGLKEVSALNFKLAEDADKGGSAVLLIEDILFNGMKYADFGLTYREPTSIDFHGKSKSNDMSVKAMQSAQNVSLTFNAIKSGTASVALYSLNGRELAVSQSVINAGSNQLSLNTESIGTGVYVMRLNVNGAITASRISISK